MTYCVSGNKDRASGKYLWRGLVHVRDGVIVDAAPVWGIHVGKPFSALEAIGKERGYLIEARDKGQAGSVE
jgi:hypothetical protein